MPRCIELPLALFGVLVLLPLFGILALAVKVQDNGPALYRAVRVGRHGTNFKLLKFRSMVDGAEKSGSGLTTRNDKRVTPVGRFLRRYKLDELPQLVNVLKGDMSFVGPRPEDPVYVGKYTDEQRTLLAYRPGITSPASLEYKEESLLLDGPYFERIYREKILPRKLAIELEYVRKRTNWKDLQIIVKTVLGLFRKE